MDINPAAHSSRFQALRRRSWLSWLTGILEQGSLGGCPGISRQLQSSLWSLQGEPDLASTRMPSTAAGPEGEPCPSFTPSHEVSAYSQIGSELGLQGRAVAGAAAGARR